MTAVGSIDKDCDYFTFTGDMLACIDIHEVCEKSVCVLARELLLWWFSRQVGNQRSDGTDVCYDSKHNGEH